MSEPLSPKKPEKVIKIEVLAREAHLIKELRQYPFGKFVVHKANNLLVRFEANESKLLSEEEGLCLATTNNNKNNNFV